LKTLFQEDFTINIFKFSRGIGKVNTYVSKAGCTQHGITNSMKQYICIAMAQCAFVVGDFNAANPQIPALN